MVEIWAIEPLSYLNVSAANIVIDSTITTSTGSVYVKFLSDISLNAITTNGGDVTVIAQDINVSAPIITNGGNVLLEAVGNISNNSLFNKGYVVTGGGSFTGIADSGRTGAEISISDLEAAPDLMVLVYIQAAVLLI